MSVRVYALRALRMRWAHEETPVKDKLRCSGCDKPFKTRGGLDYHTSRTGHGAPVQVGGATEPWPSRDDFLAMCGEAYDEMEGNVAGVTFLTEAALEALIRRTGARFGPISVERPGPTFRASGFS